MRFNPVAINLVDLLGNMMNRILIAIISLQCGKDFGHVNRRDSDVAHSKSKRQRITFSNGCCCCQDRVIVRDRVIVPLSTGNNWHFPSGRVNNCWNCNGDHGVNKCKLPKDQARIEHEEVGGRKEEEVWFCQW